MRLYFYDPATRREIDTPLNGARRLSAGPFVIENGRRVPARWRLTAETRATTAAGREPWGAAIITIDDFPQHERVRVKAWHPNGSEWFDLMRQPDDWATRKVA